MRTFVLAFLLVNLSIGATFAQTKEEIKEWKKKLKDLEPMEYKKLVEERDELAMETANLEGEVADLQTENAKLQSELDDYKAAAKAAEAKLNAQEAQSPSETTDGGDMASDGTDSNIIDGVVYKVQIGAYRGFDLSKYLDNHPNFQGEVDEDGTMRYTIGQFKEYWEADKFKKYLRDMGVKGAWIVSYKDGKRVPIKDVLEGVIN